jgi:hypothetical protein
MGGFLLSLTAAVAGRITWVVFMAERNSGANVSQQLTNQGIGKK